MRSVPLLALRDARGGEPNGEQSRLPLAGQQVLVSSVRGRSIYRSDGRASGGAKPPLGRRPPSCCTEISSPSASTAAVSQLRRDLQQVLGGDDPVVKALGGGLHEANRRCRCRMRTGDLRRATELHYARAALRPARGRERGCAFRMVTIDHPPSGPGRGSRPLSSVSAAHRRSPFCAHHPSRCPPMGRAWRSRPARRSLSPKAGRSLPPQPVGSTDNETLVSRLPLWCEWIAPLA
jgi:hypothetical protein